MDPRRAQLELFVRAGRLLLEYNESTGAIHNALTATAFALTREGCDVAISYSGIAVALAGEAPLLMPVREIRYNTAVQSQIYMILEGVRYGDLDTVAALERLRSVESDTPRHAPWLAAIALGAGGAGLAGLLAADAGAAVIAAVSTGLGHLIRQWLHRRHASLLALPLAAAFVSGVLGGVAIRLGWTQTPGMALVVPCLMLVPGPHLINGLLDLIDKCVPMAVARLGLATGILMASSLGLLAGVKLTHPNLPEMKQSFRNDQLNLPADMILAGVVTCAFALYYNTTWPQIGPAVAGGAMGHGLRFLALQAGFSLEAASFVGGFAVGVVSAWICRRNKMPVAVIAFSGAVTMMPGLQIYSAVRGGLQLARLQNESDLPTIAGTLAHGIQSAVVVGALALGLIIAIRVVQSLPGEHDPAESRGE
jgi:uncharacterized membrane protein YjjP (DUF1212 family)